MQAEMDYNGLGQRLSMDAAGVIAHYVMDGDRPLTAETGGNTNFYLYGPSAGSGWGAIGEKTAAWSFSLPDGTNTPRQLSDVSGEITLTSRYTPWGDTLDTFGTGNFTFGYFGGVMDAATGLLYVGNGQYYDPSTGRFLTRDVYPNSTNPYIPWNPIGAIVGPLGLVALVFGRRKKGSKVAQFLVLVLVAGSVGMTLAACGGGQATVTATYTPGAPVTYVATFADGTTVAGTLPASTGAAIVIATSCATVPPTPTPSPTGTPTPIPTISVNINDRAKAIRNWASELGYSTVEVLAILLNREALNPSLEDSRWFAGDKNGKRDPAEIYREAATRWYWTWIKDAWVINKYGNATNDVDREAMAYQWIVNGMQSEDGWTKDILRSQHDALNPGFINIASSVLHPSNSEWAKGDGMWGWANAYLYAPKGRQIMEQNHLYAWGFGDTKWYIVDADTVRQITPYRQ